MFLNATMLAGLAGAVIPLVLHLLSRSRYKTVEWGAMMFLEGAEARVMQAARVKQVIILLLRMAIVALLAMALAQPVIRGRWGGLAGESRASAVIVLDCSASMGFDESGKSRLDLARGAVLTILESLRENRVAVVILGGGRGAEDLATPTTDLQQLAQRVMAIPEPAGRADIAAGLTRAMDILDRTAEPTRELYVVTDRQASGWREASADPFRDAWRSRLAKPGTRTRFFVVPVGSEKAENLSIESVELVNGPAIKEQPAEVEVRVRNYGRTYRGGVELKVDGVSTTVSVGPDATATARVNLRPHQAGSRIVTATLPEAGLSFDDRMQAAIEVVEPISVLVVSGDERGDKAGGLQSESDFLRIALAPSAEAKRRGLNSGALRADPCAVTVEPYESWRAEELKKHQVVVLANVPQLTQGQAVALEQYAYEGGGVWVAPGNLTRVDNLNAMLYRDGTGILPAKLLPPTAEDGSEATTIQGISDFDHPAFRFLKGRPDPVPAVAVGRYFPVEVRNRDARVLGQYASGRPFVVEGVTGRAHVLLMTVPLDADWGTLPLTSFYLPMAQSAVRYLAAGSSAERNLRPGEPIVARFGPGVDARRVRIDSPTGDGGAPRPVVLPVTGGEVRFAGTLQPGVYRMTVIDGAVPDWARVSHFVVQTPPRESDLTALTAAQWGDLSRGLEFELVDQRERAIGPVVSAARRGRELWLSVIGAVVILSLVELAVVRRWGGAA
ncbi:MAG TPA: VWA domain-containing protein [Tepidisphaeraceae bacterium]|nr:VWA domain-containing protein [Tepidisphaeraceae bacterium]